MTLNDRSIGYFVTKDKNAKVRRGSNTKTGNDVQRSKNILEENVKNQTDKTENHPNNNNINDTNNIILREIITDKPKFKWFNAFLCCFKKT